VQTIPAIPVYAREENGSEPGAVLHGLAAGRVRV